QFHYYPDGRATLEPQRFDPQFPGIIGEFATVTTDVWPDLIGNDQTVADRLQLAAARGYPLAIPWSFLAKDRYTAWSATVEQDVRTFTQLNRHRASRT